MNEQVHIQLASQAARFREVCESIAARTGIPVGVIIATVSIGHNTAQQSRLFCAMAQETEGQAHATASGQAILNNLVALINAIGLPEADFVAAHKAMMADFEDRGCQP